MANTVSRLTSNGINYITGQFDEVTFNTNSGYKKNLLPSSDILSTGWNLSGSTVTASGISPDGVSTAYLLKEDTSTNSSHWEADGNIYIQPKTTYTFSCYYKIYSGDRQFYFTAFDAGAPGGISYAGTVSSNNGTSFVNSYVSNEFTNGNFTLTPKGDGWFRISLSFTTGPQQGLFLQFRLGLYNNGAQYYTGNGTSGIYVWGPQFELGNTATIFEPTDGSSISTSNAKSKIDSSGNHFISGSFDEVTFNKKTPVVKNLLVANTSTMTVSNGWGKGSNTTFVGITTAPDGSNTATIYTGNGSGAMEYLVKQPYYAANTTYTASVWARLNSGSVPTNGTIISISYTYDTAGNQTRSTVPYSGNLTSTWTRFSTTYKNVVPGSYSAFFNADQTNTANIELWGAQVELGSNTSIYQPLTLVNTIENPPASKRINNGDYYVSGNYDEWTGILSTTNGLVFHLDAGNSDSTTGSQLAWNDISDSQLVAGYREYIKPSTYNQLQSAYNFKYAALNGFYLTAANTTVLKTSTFTLETWVKHSEFVANGPYFDYYIIWELYATQGFRFGCATPNGLSTDTTGKPVFWTNQSGGNFSLSNNTYPININTWCQIVVTYDGSTCNIYVNGSLYATQTSATYNIPSNNSFHIGGDANGCGSFTGQMSILRWYNRAISANEVLENFNGNRNRYGI